MPKTTPWYSALESDVYHNNTDCTKGNNIEAENIRQGDDGRRLCDECKELAGKESKDRWGW